MRLVAKVSGWVLLVIGGCLIALGVVSWPPGGLMFALPFVFLMPGVLFAAIGVLLVWVGNRPSAARKGNG